mgnify:CR=1 FL=1
MTKIDMDTEDDFGQQDAPEVEVRFQPHFYFLAAVRVAYLREERLKERSVNILLDLQVPYVSQQTLADINRAAATRIIDEMAIQLNDIQDIVIQSVSSLGAMTPEEFRGTADNTVSKVDLEPEQEAPEGFPEEAVAQDVQEGV